MRNALNDDLENIDKIVRANVTMESIIRTLGRRVGLIRNYLKDSDDLLFFS